MASRMTAAWRALAILWAWTLGGFIMGLIAFVGFILGVVDILWTAITGGEGISPSGRAFTWVAESFMWWADLHVFAFTGKGGGFEWFPSV